MPENVTSDSSSSDMDFRREAYRLATNSKKRKKKLKGKNKPHGKRPVPSYTTTSAASSSLSSGNEWFFKVTVGRWDTNNKKIITEKNCLIRCDDATTCTKLKELVGRELMEPPSSIYLYDSDFLPLSDSLGRIGMYLVNIM